jgi:glycosyl transferase family 25
MNLKGYVINLASSTDRMRHAQAELAANNIETVRVEGFDGREIDVATFAPYDDDKARKFMGRSMSGGEIGCYVGHQRALQAFCDSGDPIAIVFEDDIMFADGAAEKIGALIDWLRTQDDWHCINIGATRLKITSPYKTLGGIDVVNAHYFPMLAHALIWSQAGAQAFLDAAEPIYCPADNMFRQVFTKSDKGFATVENLVSAGSFDSDISARSGGNRGADRRSPLYCFRKQRRLLQEKAIAFVHKICQARHLR